MDNDDEDDDKLFSLTTYDLIKAQHHHFGLNEFWPEPAFKSLRIWAEQRLC